MDVCSLGRKFSLLSPGLLVLLPHFCCSECGVEVREGQVMEAGHSSKAGRRDSSNCWNGC